MSFQNIVRIAFFSFFVFSCSSEQKNEMTPEKKKSEVFYSYGTYYLINKNYTKALDNLIKASKLTPKNSKVHNNLGMAYYFKGEERLGLVHLKKALDLDEKNSDARNNLAGILLKRGEINKAEHQYLQIGKDLVYDQQFRTYYNLGLIQLKKDNILKAAEYFEKSISLKKDYCPAHFELGQLQFKNFNYEKAYKSFLSSSKGTCYEEPAPVYYQALSLLKMARPTQAKKKLEEVVGRFQHTKYATLSTIKLKSLTSSNSIGTLNGTKD